MSKQPSVWSRTNPAVAGFVAAAMICFPLGQCSGAKRERDRAAAEQTAALIQASKTDARINESLAGQRVADTARIAATAEEQSHAVETLPDALPSARQRARACTVLRQQGTPEGALPAGC